MQDIRIFRHRPHIVLRYEVRENTFGDLPVLQHITYPAGSAQIIFEDVKSAVVIAYQVDACNMNVDIVGHGQAMDLPQEMRAAIDHLGRDDPILQDELFVVNILEEEVQGLQPLADTLLDIFPFGSGDDPGNDVEGEDLFYAFAAAVNGERNALAHKKLFCQLLFSVQLIDAHLLHKVHHSLVLLPDRKVGVHFVPGVGVYMIAVEQFACLHTYLVLAADGAHLCASLSDVCPSDWRTGRLCSWQAGIVNYSKYKNNQAFKKLFLWANHFHEQNCHDPRPLCSYPFSGEAHAGARKQNGDPPY